MLNTKIKIHLHDALFYLLLVFSFYFTRNIVCSLMMVAFFGFTVLRKYIGKQKTMISFFFIGFLIFILYGALNIVLDNVIDHSVAKTMVTSLVLNLMMIYAIVQYIYMEKNVPKILRITELGIFTTAFVVVLISIGTITSGRLGGDTEVNANLLAILCVYGFILCMYLHKADIMSKRSYWFRLVFYFLAVLLTGSRKGLIMIFIAVAIINFIFGKKKLVRNILIGVASVILVYFLIMNIEFLYNIIGVRIESLLQFLTDGTISEGSLNSRVSLIEKATPYIERNPWIGYGYDCFKTVSGRGGAGNVSGDSFGYYSHNNYIELLFGGGIIGLVLYYIPMIYLLKKLFSSLKNDTYVPYLFAIFVSKLAIEYAYVSYYARADAYIVAILLGCALMSKKDLSTCIT